MNFVEEHIYDAPLSTIEKMYFDTAFCPRKYEELGLENIRILDSSDDPDRFFVDCSFIMHPTLPVPGFLNKLLQGGQKMNVRQIDRWNTKTRKGELDIQLQGFDIVKIHATMKLEEHPRGAINTMNWTIECKVPLVGNKIASFLGKDIQSKAAQDHAVSLQILDDYK
ncbi:MAG: DUF2505 domain-containing protein [Oceanococcus sp.]